MWVCARARVCVTRTHTHTRGTGSVGDRVGEGASERVRVRACTYDTTTRLTLVGGVPQSPLSMVTMRNLRARSEEDTTPPPHKMAAHATCAARERHVAYEALENDREGSAWAPLWQGPEVCLSVKRDLLQGKRDLL